MMRTAVPFRTPLFLGALKARTGNDDTTGDDSLVIWIFSARSPENARIAPYKKGIRGANHMPKAYWITTYREIKDPAKLSAYSKLAPVALAPFGVRYLCRGTPDVTYESGLKERVVVSEFPSLEKAVAGHDSPGYKEALRALGDGAVRDIRIISGVE
jgi:uncharacterized protein (DUF1330 family)